MSHGAAERERIILEHLSQVEIIARKLLRHLPRSVELNDLLSVGVFGLIAAVDHYDASHKVKLRTYAEQKIRGAMLDSLRRLDWAPRRQRWQSKRIERITEALEQKLKQHPSEEEIAEGLGITLAEAQSWRSEESGLKMRSLYREDGNLRYVADTAENGPEAIAVGAEMAQLLALHTDQLPELERTVIMLHYYQEMSAREIAEYLGVSVHLAQRAKVDAVARLQRDFRVAGTSRCR